MPAQDLVKGNLARKTFNALPNEMEDIAGIISPSNRWVSLLFFVGIKKRDLTTQTIWISVGAKSICRNKETRLSKNFPKKLI